MEWMDILESALHVAVKCGIWIAELVGVVIAVVAVIQALWGWLHHNERVRLQLGEGIALALQFKLAGEVLRTVSVRTWTEIGILGAIILMRFAITFLIHWEVKNEEKRIQLHHKQEEKEAIRQAMRRAMKDSLEQNGAPEQLQEREHE